MNYPFFNEQIAGNWIVQSTNYSSKKNSDFIEILTNQVRYTNLINTNFYLKLLSHNSNLNSSYKKIEIYCIKYKNKNHSVKKQYLLIFHDKYDKIVLFKFNNKFEYLNKFTVSTWSKNYLSIISKKNNITIIEKIYFLNNNLKVIKTIVKKHEKNIAVAFSSEIRIS